MYLQGWKLQNLSWQLMPVLSYHHSNKLFPHVQRKPSVFWFVPTASGPVTRLYCEAPGAVFFTPSLQPFAPIGEVPPPYSSPG